MSTDDLLYLMNCEEIENIGVINKINLVEDITTQNNSDTFEHKGD